MSRAVTPAVRAVTLTGISVAERPLRGGMSPAVRLSRLLAQIAIWPLLGFLIIAFDDLGPSLFRSSRHELYAFLQWGLLTPVVVQLALRFPLIEHVARNATIHVISALATCFLQLIGEPKQAVVAAHIPPRQYLAESISRNLLMYASVAVAAHLFVLARRKASAQHEALAAAAKATEAERMALERAVAPELVVESLDAIADAIRHEPQRADALIEAFSDELRARLPR